MVVLVIMIMMTAKVCTHSAYADHHHPTHQTYEHVKTKTCFLDHLPQERATNQLSHECQSITLWPPSRQKGSTVLVLSRIPRRATLLINDNISRKVCPTCKCRHHPASCHC